MLFAALPVLERFATAEAAGFDAVEILFPDNESPTAILNGLQENSLDLAPIDTPPGNWADGERGCAADPGAEDQFRRDFDRALGYAERLQAWHAHRSITRPIQVAGYPGRHEPIVREADYPAFFTRLDKDAYGGFVGGEQHLKGRTTDSMCWTALMTSLS